MALQWQCWVKLGYNNIDQSTKNPLKILLFLRRTGHKSSLSQYFPEPDTEMNLSPVFLTNEIEYYCY